ncbi:MAG TPA: DUF5686 and carboxypeptidase regulatory-like domain-containing protein [Bacteroidia bacterium]|nr:DUF5686 and carboxypeptidase regulatory-like domain-containing protein [Bacteroidia bacterium]
MNRSIFILLFLFVGRSSSAHVLSGRVTGTNGEPVSFGAVYVKGTTKGTTSNEFGYYTLELAPGIYTMVFQGMGYTTRHVEADLRDGNVTLNIELAPNSIQLRPAVISAGEDPAYAIMRSAIKKRKYYRDQVESFSCDVYIKGLQRVTDYPKKIMGMEVDPTGEIDSVSGIVYLSESVSKFNFKQPNLLREEMVSSKVSGDNHSFSYNRASDMMFDFYQNVIEIDELSERGFVSPIANDALFFYRFKLTGSIVENDSLIHKIEVIPKRKSDPCFRGHIYIMEGSWRIYSTELYLTKDAQIDFVDTLMISQTYVPVEKDIWMVFMNRFTFVFGFMGLKGNGVYIGVNSNFILEPEYPKKFFTNEEMTVKEDANKKDSVYWADSRPVPLTWEEERDYHRRDSIMKVHSSKEFLDSVDKKTNRPGFMDILLTGYAFNRSYKRFFVSVSPLVRMCSFNTVQGVRAAAEINFRKSWVNNKFIEIGTDFSYGLGDRKFYADFDATYAYKPVRFERIIIAGGTSAAQFNPRDPIGVFFNSIYTLVGKENHMKLFAKSYGSVTWNREIVNGLMFFGNVEYAERTPLYNTSLFYWIEYADKPFTSNDPLNPGDHLSAAFDPHKALTFNIQATYRIKQKYYTRPNEKIILGSKWPSFGFQYRKGVPGIAGSATNYDFIKISVRDRVNLKLLGKFTYYFGCGKFVSKKNLPFTDYYHFMGNRILWSVFTQQSYHLLDYYTYSANNWYFEAHAEHHFAGLFLGNIPLIRRLKLTEVAGVNWLMTQAVPSYYEIYFGVNKLGVIRVDFALGYMQNAKVSAGLRAGLRI